MNLHNHYGGIFYRRTADQVADAHHGIEIDYWYMAQRISAHSNIIDFNLCTIIYDHLGNRFECKSIHQGDYKEWKEVIRKRMETHLLKVGVDKLMARRICRDIVISKDRLEPFDRQDFLHKKRNSL